MIDLKKKWLNKDTPEWLEVLKDIQNNKFDGVWMLRSEFKVSKVLEKEINKLTDEISNSI